MMMKSCVIDGHQESSLGCSLLSCPTRTFCCSMLHQNVDSSMREPATAQFRRRSLPAMLSMLSLPPLTDSALTAACIFLTACLLCWTPVFATTQTCGCRVVVSCSPLLCAVTRNESGAARERSLARAARLRMHLSTRNVLQCNGDPGRDVSFGRAFWLCLINWWLALMLYIAGLILVEVLLRSDTHAEPQAQTSQSSGRCCTRPPHRRRCCPWTSTRDARPTLLPSGTTRGRQRSCRLTMTQHGTRRRGAGSSHGRHMTAGALACQLVQPPSATQLRYTEDTPIKPV